MNKMYVGAVQLVIQPGIEFLQEYSPRNAHAVHDIHAVVVNDGKLRLE
jgi:hypothetical protein